MLDNVWATFRPLLEKRAEVAGVAWGNCSRLVSENPFGMENRDSVCEWIVGLGHELLQLLWIKFYLHGFLYRSEKLVFRLRDFDESELMLGVSGGSSP